MRLGAWPTAAAFLLLIRFTGLSICSLVKITLANVIHSIDMRGWHDPQ
jgi:hypothetical protein